jgi:hypothetical protein
VVLEIVQMLACLYDASTFTYKTCDLPYQPTLRLVAFFQTENSTKTMYNIMKSDATSLIIAGDLSYADGDPYRYVNSYLSRSLFHLSLQLFIR